jgi:large subunit ribosomal protein L9
MKIILNEDVYNLGEEGDICDVAKGYARNYLFPKNLAVSHTKENLSVFESRRSAIKNRKEEKRTAAQGLKERIEGKEIRIPMNAGDTGKLFGSVTNAMIIDELAKEGIELEKKQIDLPSNSIKMTGSYPIMVKLYESESAEIVIKVYNQNKPQEAVAGPTETTEKIEAAEADAEAAVEAAYAEEEAGEADTGADEEEAPADEERSDED